MTVRAYSLKGNSVVEKGIETLSLKSALTWVRMVNPTDEEIKKMLGIMDITVDVFEDCLDEAERPRIENEDYVLIIYRVPLYDEDDIVTKPVGFIIKGNLVVTVCRKNAKSFDDISKLFSTGRGKFVFQNGPAGIVFKLIEKMNERYLNVINKIVDASDIIEEKIFETDKKHVQKLLFVNTTLAYFHNSLAANLEVMKMLQKGYIKKFRGENCVEMFEDLYLDVLELIDAVKIQREIINNLFDMQSTIISYELNVVMKKITAIAAVIMIPTLITGIYGMNFNHLPYSDYIYGFYAVLGIMFLTIVLLVLYFKRLKWL